MRTIVAWMNPKAPAPAGGGSTDGWFEYYKMPEEGECWLPFHPSVDIKAGDELWFLMGPRVLGHTTVLRTDDANANGWLEVWYESKDIHRIKANQQEFDVKSLFERADFLYPLWDSRLYR